MMLTQPRSARHLAALDIDGTLAPEGARHVPSRTTEAVTAVRAEGHDVILASGRSLAGILPVAGWLGLTDTVVVASNGAVTARLTPDMPGGYEVIDAEMLEVGPVIELARTNVPSVRVAIEEIGYGYSVSANFPEGTINGRQWQLPVKYMMGASPRLILRAPGIAAELMPHLRTLTVTAHPSSDDSIDVTPAGLSKATALETIRADLGIPRSQVVAVGDGENDIDMLRWASAGGGRSVAMGHAPQTVRDAAGEVTGDLTAEGVVPVLRSLLSAERVLEAAR